MKTPPLQPALLVLAIGAFVAGCGTAPSKTAQAPVVPPYTGGGYYKDDGPGANPPDNLDSVPDAVPRREPLHRFANSTYRIKGRTYQPVSDNTDFKERGLASWYGRKFHGKPTSTGEPYDMYAMTAAHPTLPLPSYARVTNLENGRSVVVRLNDRGPFHAGRVIDLSYTAAHKLDALRNVTPVEVEAILPDAAPTSFIAGVEAAVPAEVAAVPATGVTPEASASASFQSAATHAPIIAAVPIEPMRTSATPSTARAETGQVIWLQLGAFSSLASAENLLLRASARLSRDFPGVMRLESDGLHRVQAGPFSADRDADQAVASIQTHLGITPFRIRAAAASSTATDAAPKSTAGLDTPSGAGLYLQLGAVSNVGAAEALADRVKRRFGEELPGIEQVPAGGFYRVQAGPFVSATSADRVALAYQRDFGVKPFRVTR